MVRYAFAKWVSRVRGQQYFKQTFQTDHISLLPSTPFKNNKRSMEALAFVLFNTCEPDAGDIYSDDLNVSWEVGPSTNNPNADVVNVTRVTDQVKTFTPSSSRGVIRVTHRLDMCIPCLKLLLLQGKYIHLDFGHLTVLSLCLKRATTQA